MTRKIILTVFSFALITSSCSNLNSNDTTPGSAWFDKTAFPKAKFYKVALLTIDKSVDTASAIRLEEKGIYQQIPEINIGEFFVDNSGRPLHKFYKEYSLDSFQIARLEKFLFQSPCFGGSVTDKSCFPTYRDVFIFYDERNEPLAEANICFDCEMAGFSPLADYMCNFENTVDFTALQEFTDSIKLAK